MVGNIQQKSGLWAIKCTFKDKYEENSHGLEIWGKYLVQNLFTFLVNIIYKLSVLIAIRTLSLFFLEKNKNMKKCWNL